MHNENRSRQSQSQTSETQNLNITDNAGPVLANSSGNVINVTDGGVVESVSRLFTDLSSDLAGIGRDALASGETTAVRGLDFAENAYESSLGFATDVNRDSLDAVTNVATSFMDRLAQSNEGALSTIQQSQDSAIGIIGDIVNGLFGFAESAIDNAGANAVELAGQSIAGNQSLAKSTSESADDRVTRLGMYAFLAIGAILVAQAYFRK